ncbi:hypothetical protein EJ05DRAFT_479157 [Pseudovirgaria hyperparasitica]|uniref:Mid2 domain-containing protein n=1 Tax=Pseudovirgaria hyperparasitica TaxID=470096 RepID=A0A6A6VVL5_9PEZI|nr:uncharacterized protein EJ05DRAFT_479157 [Pseudovirgaria hyperparasitica]KAF2754728.1 hypothetical protein EJ05DRAFT_479157 [Pseudovirgaria hyperparasitica]
MVVSMGRVFMSAAILAPVMISAVPWNGPRATGDAGAEVVGWSPAPTSPPLLYRGMDSIFERQASRGDNTCGYGHDDPSNTFSCIDDSYVCATNSFYGVHGCCNPNSLNACSIKTTCVPSSEASSCTGACASNGYVALCTAGSLTGCYNILYDFGTTTMTEWGCSNVDTTILVDYSTSGESLLPDTSQVEVPISTRVITVNPSESAEDSSADTATTIGSSSNGINSSNEGSSTNVGAIAGGVVGGVAGLAIIVAGIVFLLMRRKKKSKAAAAAAAPAAAGGYQPPPMSGPQGPQSSVPQGTYPQGAYPQQNYGQQTAYDPSAQQATAGYYQPQDPSKQPPTQDYKYNYNAPGAEAPPPAAGAAELGGGSQAPYTQPSSPPPGATAQHDSIQQLDSTTVNPTGQTSPKPVVHEIGS